MIALTIICFVCGLAWSFLHCYFATFATERISSTGDAVWSTNWFDYSPEMRQYVPLIIARSQKPALFTGFNLMPCTLEMFGKVRIILIFVHTYRRTKMKKNVTVNSWSILNFVDFQDITILLLDVQEHFDALKCKILFDHHTKSNMFEWIK